MLTAGPQGGRAPVEVKIKSKEVKNKSKTFGFIINTAW